MEARIARIAGIEGADVALETDRERWFGEFVAAHRDRAVGLAWRLVDGDAAAAEDVAQEAFVRAYRALDRFRGDARMGTWFYRILVNEAHRYRRWRWVRARRAVDTPAEDARDPRADVVGDPSLRARIAKALEKLPRGQRETFVLVHLEGFTLGEAAEITGRAVGTMKSRLHRALEALRHELADVAEAREVAS